MRQLGSVRGVQCPEPSKAGSWAQMPYEHLAPLRKGHDTLVMADMSGVYALISGLGGAGIGVLGGGLLQRAKRQQDAVEMEALAKRLALEIATTARICVQAWGSAVERVVQDLETGRPVDVDRFDDEFPSLQRELTEAIYRFPAAGAAAHVPWPVVPAERPFVDRVAEATGLLRSDLLSMSEGIPGSCPPRDRLLMAEQIRWDIDFQLILVTEQITGREIPPATQLFSAEDRPQI